MRIEIGSRAQRLWQTHPGLGTAINATAGAMVLLFPLFASRYWTSVANYFGLYLLLGLSLNIIVGYAGLFQLGHAAFFAVGAYTTAILNTTLDIPILWLLPVSGLVTAVVAYVFTRPVIHLRGDYLCIVTIGVGEIVRIALLQNVFGLTGGPNGIFGIDRPSLFGFRIYQQSQYYYLILLFVVLTIVGSYRLQRSRIGRAWTCIREDDIAAEAMGIDVTYYKTLSFVLGGAVAGMVGTLYAGWITVISPSSFDFWESVVMFCIVILGGAGSVPGIVLGTVGMVLLPEIFRQLADYRMLVFGAAMVVMMIFRPQGLLPSQTWGRALQRPGDDREVPAVAASED